MAKYSISSYTADGSTTDFLITWDYLDTTHIKVYVDGVSTADAGSGYQFSLINSTTVRVTTDLGATPPNGAVIEIRRETPVDTKAVTFNDGSSLNGGDLNTNSDYLLYAMQETIDTIDIAAQDGAAQASAAAAQSATDAENSKLGADAAALAALGYRDQAETHKNDAATSAGEAAASAASLNIDQNVSTTGTPTFSSVTAGQVNSSGAVIATGAGQFGDDVSVTGDITVTGTVDGRDVAADGAKLDTVTVPAGGFAGVTATQTLTNKTLTSPAITGTPVEDVYALSGTSVSLEPDNGSVQTHTLSGNTTYTDGFSAGQAVTLMIDDGTAYTVTWPTMTWVNNGAAAPTLATSGYTVVALWKVSTTLYGALVGDGS